MKAMTNYDNIEFDRNSYKIINFVLLKLTRV
jgi:hypothetical protein